MEEELITEVLTCCISSLKKVEICAFKLPIMRLRRQGYESSTPIMNRKPTFLIRKVASKAYGGKKAHSCFRASAMNSGKL